MTPYDQSRATNRNAFVNLLDTVRRRWWQRRLIEGALIAATLALLLAAAALAWMATSRFAPDVVTAARALLYLGVPLLCAGIVLPRVLRRLAPRAAARYLEARLGGDHDALLLSAVEASGRGPATDGDGSLAERLYAEALAACRTGPCPATALELPRLRRAGAALGVLLAVAAGVVWWGTPPLRHGVGLVLAPGADAEEGNPYRLTVSPGDLAVVAGEDVAIAALPENFVPGSVELLVRQGEDDPWRVQPMTRANDASRFDALLFNLEGSREYYVRSGNVVSSQHRIEVTPRPRVARIDLRYEYPPRTGRAPELVRDGGAIRAVRGSRVEVRATPERPVAGGELVVDGIRRIPLQAVDGELRAVLDLEVDGHYRIELDAGRAGLVTASAEHPVQVHDDGLPQVAIDWPGRDVRVTSIEEVEIRVEASDDVAVRDVELVLNINGADEQVVAFASDPAAPGRLQAVHPMMLETIGLAPGDMISYYARVRDAAGDPARQVATDLYFLDVRPFEKRFRPAGGGAGGGGPGGGGQGEAELTAQQRELLVALFKVKRDRGNLQPERVAERVATLGEAQARIRDRVEAIVRRVQARSFIAGNDGYQSLAEELPRAAAAMVEVEGRLAASEIDVALPSARRALLHLQRADAAFRDVQVAMARSRGGGGGEQASQELANLFQLEMDRFRNQYENLQRGRWNQGERGIDEALDKLREMARRQQREIDRTRLRGPGQGNANSQQALAEELEKLIRDLERLTRDRDERRAQQAKRSLEQLQGAREAMQRAAQAGDGAAGREALQRLDEVRRELERARPGRLAHGVGEALRRAESALESQREIGGRIAAVDAADSVLPGAELEGLVDRKRALAGELRQLGNALERLRGQARAQHPEVAEDLDAAGNALDQRRVEERMRRSATALARNPIAYPAAGEAEFEREIDYLRERLARADAGLQGSAQGDRQADVERLRALVRGMQADQRRLAEAANRGRPGGQEGGRPGAGGGEDRGDGAVGNASSGPGGEARGGGLRPGAGWAQGLGTGGDTDYALDFSALREQLLERMRSVAELDDRFGDLGRVAEDVAEVIGAIDAVDGVTPGAGDLETLRARQAALLYRVQQLEATLRQDGAAADAVAVAPRPVSVPPRFRAQVETYYRRLGEEGERARHE